MAVSAKWFTLGKKHLAWGDVVWKAAGGSDIRVALMKTTFSWNQDTMESWADVSAQEIAAGSGYIANGASMTLIDAAYSSSKVVILDANDVTWSSSTITAYYAVVYKYNATAAQAYLLGYVDFGGAVTSTNGDFKITWPADGVLKDTVS